jgi:hypothetical protein
MSKKKITIEEFNKDFFNSWTKITKIIPRFEEWTQCGYEDDESVKKVKVITNIDIEFDNGEKLSILPFSNKEEFDEEICSGLKIVQYKAEEVNWRVPKD